MGGASDGAVRVDTIPEADGLAEAATRANADGDRAGTEWGQTGFVLVR